MDAQLDRKPLEIELVLLQIVRIRFNQVFSVILGEGEQFVKSVVFVEKYIDKCNAVRSVLDRNLVVVFLGTVISGHIVQGDQRGLGFIENKAPAQDPLIFVAVVFESVFTQLLIRPREEF